MNNAAHLADRLDLALDRMFASEARDVTAKSNGCPTLPPQAEGGKSDEDAALDSLVAVAHELQSLPRASFKERLALELDAAANTRRANSDPRALAVAAQMLPTLFGGGMAVPPVARVNVAASLLVHALGLAVVLGSTYYVAENRGLPAGRMVDLVARELYPLPPAPDTSGGGGGGGDRSKLDASHGALPKASSEQITPPAVKVPNEAPKLEVAPTVILSADLQSPKLPVIGDPTATPLLLSNGPGSSSGIGTGKNGGIGEGDGRGIGIGSKAGYGGSIYRVGHGGVSAPRAIYAPDPDYSEEARKVKHQGVVGLWLIVGPDGRPRDIRVQRSLGMGLDEKAVEAVRTWKFEPAKKDGVAVPVQITVEVSFRLY